MSQFVALTEDREAIRLFTVAHGQDFRTDQVVLAGCPDCSSRPAGRRQMGMKTSDFILDSLERMDDAVAAAVDGLSSQELTWRPGALASTTMRGRICSGHDSTEAAGMGLREVVRKAQPARGP